MRGAVIVVLGLAAGCSSEGAATKQEKPTDKPRTLAGVYPERWQCESVTKTDALVGLLGAVKVKQMDSAISPPRGLPQPCTYEVVMQTEMEYWTYDLDCRDGVKQRADALFAQYTRTSKELVEAYNAAADAGIKPTDAGVAVKPPEDAVEVQVGAKALDHHGRGLLFVDDDAPCYVRVIGPDAPRRLELAKAVAKGLTFANAPMTPRPMP